MIYTALIDPHPSILYIG